MTTTQYSRLLILLAVCLAGGSFVATAQDRKNACSNSKPATFTIQCKDRYYLGETPTITLSMSNTGRTLMTVKELEYQKFSLKATGLFSNDSVVQKKKINYDGSIYIPPSRNEGGVMFWYGPVVRTPKYVTLRPGESTTLTLDLSESFGENVGVGRYELVFKSEDGHKVVKEFEIYFDNEKTVPLMVRRLQEQDNVAIYYLSQFNRPMFMTSLQEMATTGNEKQREFAKFLLADVSRGNFNPLELVVITPTRQSRANPNITISILNRSRSPETVKEAQQQKFSLELRKVGSPGKPSEYYEEIKKCVYTPKEPQQKARLVNLAPNEATNLTLSLQDCFGAGLEAGTYEVIVTSDRDEQVKAQTAEQRFQIRGH